jgi:hypothetical protein
LIIRKCEKCGWEWAPRKPVPPKKCPRCQHPYKPTLEKPAEFEKTNPFARATPDQIHYLEGVLEILRENDPILAGGIKRAVDTHRHIRRKAGAVHEHKRDTG